MRLNDLAVGSDGRNRTILSAFRSRTGRNQPSNTKYIFGPSVWLRGLIKPPPGHGIAYVDWSQQEFGIAAALSGDTAMQAAYRSGDPYLAFAKQAGAVPSDATKASHKETRELFKQCVLGVQYGMEAEALAARIGQPANRCARSAASAPRDLPARSGAGPTRPSIRPCFTDRCTPSSGGASTPVRMPTRDHCETFRCKQRRRNAAARLLLSDRARDRGLRARARRRADLRTARPCSSMTLPGCRRRWPRPHGLS